jgi:hypothetical protein
LAGAGNLEPNTDGLKQATLGFSTNNQLLVPVFAYQASQKSIPADAGKAVSTFRYFYSLKISKFPFENLKIIAKIADELLSMP